MKETSKSYGVLDELYVDGVDIESIWEEVQTRNRPLIRNTKSTILNITKQLLEKDQMLQSQQQEDEEDDVSEGSQDFEGESDDDEVLCLD